MGDTRTDFMRDRNEHFRRHCTGGDITGLHAEKPRIPLATNHAASAVQADPMTAALSCATEDALFDAKRARAVLLRNTTAYVARLVRQALPEAAVIAVDTEEKELHAVLDRDGETIWYAPASAASDLHDGLVDDINGLLSDAIPFGGLAGAGWKVAGQGESYRTVLLPAADATKRRTAHTQFPGAEGLAAVHAEFTPGDPAFTLTGTNDDYARETRDRIRAGVINSGLEWPNGNTTVVAHWTVVRTGASADLAIACAALAAGGHFDPAALNRAALIGELGLDGRIRRTRDLADAVHTALDHGFRHLIVPSEGADEAIQQGARSVYGASSLNEALAYLTQIGEINKR